MLDYTATWEDSQGTAVTAPVRPNVVPWLAQWLHAQTADASRTPTPDTSYPTIGPASGVQGQPIDLSIPSDAYGDMRDIATEQGHGMGVLDFVPGLAGLRGAVRASKLSAQGRGGAAALEAATSVLPEVAAGVSAVRAARSPLAKLVGPKGNPEVQAVVEGLLHDVPSMGRVKAVNAEKAAKMAKVYEGLPVNDPAAREGYDALNAEVDRQFKAAQDAGYSFEFTDHDPYKGSAEMMADVRDNKRLKVFKTPADNFHPYMTPEQNDRFRAVHDFLAHAGPGNQFGGVGEENAFRTHAPTMPPLARQALATETRGQNSWVNFGPNAHLPPAQRPFAEQKAALWPVELTGDYSAMPGPGRGRGAVLGSRADDLQRELGYDHRASTSEPIPGSDQPEKITSAAIQLEDGRVVTGVNHADAVEKAGNPKSYYNGFQTSTGRFVDRQRAYEIATGNHGGSEHLTADQIPGPAVAHNGPMSMTVNGWDDALPEAEREALDAWQSAHPDKPFAQMEPHELEAYGRQHGVEGLGTRSTAHKVKLTDGTEVDIPGGFEGTFTPYDLFALKSQGINPNLLPEGIHEQIHQKLLRTMSHDSGDDLQLFKGLLFGITSPNSPLTPNEFTVARLMPRSMNDIKKLGEMRGKDIPAAFGIDAASKGGIGTRGSVDYEKVSELARMFHENPSWFRRMADEGWDEYADRIATQVGGLGTKTASLGAVWDDVATANTSAVDRHMITDAWDELMQDKELMRDFKPRVVSSWNNPENIGVPKGAKKARSLADILKQPGGQIFARDFMQGLATEPVSGVFRNSKGAFGASVPEKMKGLSWIREPETTNTMNPYYRKILNLQEKVRPKDMSLFGNQWLRWDRMRGRIEPHEVMHPDLHKLPPMSLDDVRASLDAHSQAGYKLGRPSVNNPAAQGAVLPAVKPVADPRTLMYWGLGGLLGAGATAGSTVGRGLLADAQ